MLDERALGGHARRFFEITSNLLAIVDRSGSMLWANDSWEKLLGIGREELLGDGYTRLIHPDDREEALRGIPEVIDSGAERPGYESRLRDADGNYRVLLWSSTVDREAGLIYGAARDITELRRSRDELAESRRMLAEAQRVSRLGAWTYSPETGELVYSDELYRIFRVDPGVYEPTYDRHMALVHPEDAGRLEQAIERLWATGEPYQFDYRVIAGDGEVVTLFTRGRVESRDDGERYIAGVCQDVSEIRESGARLARSVATLETTLEATADGIIVTDLEGRIVNWNQNYLELWGIPAEALESQDRATIERIVLEQVREGEAFLARIAELRANPEQERFDVIELKDGRVWERYSAPHRVDDEVVGRVWSFRDITDRLRAEREKLDLEARLQQAQQLESLGRLAGGIAHDFNNHLVAILNYAALAREELPPGAPGREDLDEVIGAAKRASRLTGELVAFSRQEMAEPRPLSLNDLVASAEHLLRRTLGEEIGLSIELGADVPVVEADPGQLERVLVNLALNGSDAMPGGGVLRIVTERVDAARDTMARLRVSDDGTGMTSDVAERAVEPFFTTKPKAEATGLGLATVYGIVNQNGGHVTIDSAPGRGTTVTIDLPASAKSPAPAPSRGAGQKPSPARGTVLVVEDEEPVRRLTALLLADAGFETIQAADGEEALELLGTGRVADLRLLLTDIVMPRMSGRELAERVQESRPDLPVLFMSGYTDDIVVRHGVASADLPFVAKPFTRETLLEGVREAIDAGPKPLG
jgi:two-component system, cell cycle sensor histidine kinase and response regulator CckA